MEIVDVCHYPLEAKRLQWNVESVLLFLGKNAFIMLHGSCFLAGLTLELPVQGQFYQEV